MFRIGADPELFLKQGEEFHGAHGIIPGSKNNPFPVECGAVQVDGMALEFNIEPATSAKAFVHNIDTVLNSLRRMVPKDFTFAITPVATFSEEHMREQPEEAKILGCDPDYDAYTGFPNERPEQHPVMRTAAGHIHIGWTEGADITCPVHLSSCYTAVKQLDATMGLLGVRREEPNKRAEMYGAPGAFRPKSYGVEYRVPSNWWLKSAMTKRLAYTVVTRALKSLKKGNQAFGFSSVDVKEIILTHDKNLARIYLDRSREMGII